MFNPNEFDPSDVMRELMESQHSVSLTTNELTVMSVAMETLRDRLTRDMRGAEPEKVRALSMALGDAAVLENKIDTVLKAVLSEKAIEMFGADGEN